MEQISAEKLAETCRTLQNGAREAIDYLVHTLNDAELLAALSRIASEVQSRLKSSPSEARSEPLRLVDEEARPVADLFTHEQTLSLVHSLLQQRQQSVKPRPIEGEGLSWEEIESLASR